MNRRDFLKLAAVSPVALVSGRQVASVPLGSPIPARTEPIWPDVDDSFEVLEDNRPGSGSRHYVGQRLKDARTRVEYECKAVWSSHSEWEVVLSEFWRVMDDTCCKAVMS